MITPVIETLRKRTSLITFLLTPKPTPPRKKKKKKHLNQKKNSNAKPQVRQRMR
jgi:hypothetical protein